MKTEYRGYTIRYSENEDKWSCYDTGSSHEKLSEVKKQIDAMHLKLRKASAFQCLAVSHDYAEVDEVTIIDYLRPIRKQAHTFERTPTGEVIDHEVAYMRARDGKKKARHKGALSGLVLDTPENHRKFAEARDLKARAEQLLKQAKALVKSLDAPTYADIAGLVTASEHTFAEQEGKP